LLELRWRKISSELERLLRRKPLDLSRQIQNGDVFGLALASRRVTLRSVVRADGLR
jgi:hypothetical protein